MELFRAPSRNRLESVSARLAGRSKALWGKATPLRFALLGMTTIAAVTLFIWGAAYTSLLNASHQKTTPRPVPPLASATSSATTHVSYIYDGARIIVVCSELDEIQKSRTGCP